MEDSEIKVLKVMNKLDDRQAWKDELRSMINLKMQYSWLKRKGHNTD